MPHAELKFPAALGLDAGTLLARIQKTIWAADPDCGPVKGRAYPAAHWQHDHVLLDVSLLAKPHRDAAFMDGLLAKLAETLRPALPRRCHLSIELRFSGPHYLTEYKT